MVYISSFGAVTILFMYLCSSQFDTMLFCLTICIHVCFIRINIQCVGCKPMRQSVQHCNCKLSISYVGDASCMQLAMQYRDCSVGGGDNIRAKAAALLNGSFETLNLNSFHDILRRQISHQSSPVGQRSNDAGL